MSLDVDAADTAPEEEFGEGNIQQVLGITAVDLVQVFKRERLMSFASHPLHGHLDTSVHYYWPAETFAVSLTKPVRVEQPAMLMFGFSSPSMDQTTTTTRSSPSEIDWSRMLYMADTVRDLVKNAIGLTEAGAETPYVEAQTLIASLLEDKLIEETAVADHFQEVTWNVLVDVTAQIEMNQPSDERQITAG